MSQSGKLRERRQSKIPIRMSMYKYSIDSRGITVGQKRKRLILHHYSFL